ncbi:hypothetical protein [Pontiella sp.]|uniref:hypothetical protein n=1 Tax=Pontiella sp. TaxID=2837462 RepID=UPI00356727F2
MKKHGAGSNKEGAILAIIMVILLVLTAMVLALLHLATHNSRETIYELRSAQAFWLAEAACQRSIADLYAGGDGVVNESYSASEVSGTLAVAIDSDDDQFRICTGTVNMAGRTVSRRIRFEISTVAAPFEHVIHAANRDGESWDLSLRGTRVDINNGNYPSATLQESDYGPIIPTSRGNYPGGNDVAIGNIDINGGVRLYDQSAVTAVPSPNTYNINGDVSYTQSFFQSTNATVAGGVSALAPSDYDPPNFALMDYANNNTYDVAEEFNRYGITSGRLPADHELYNVVVKNVFPGGADPTPGEDDFYFQPRSTVVGSVSTGATPLLLGDDTTYYVDGHVWFHHTSTYGFKIDGQSVIVSTRDIHISDNLEYSDNSRDESADMLALVALGQIDSITGAYLGDGNIYFGDPTYGTLFTADAFMFANNNFYYNTSSDTGEQGMPESGFRVYGNFMAMNQVVIVRDWYQRNTYVDASGNTREAVKIDGRWYDAADTNVAVLSTVTSSQRAVEYDANEDEWVDVEDGTVVDASSIAHYAMQIEYDDRIRDAATQMTGLPKGTGTIFMGASRWEEIAPP